MDQLPGRSPPSQAWGRLYILRQPGCHSPPSADRRPTALRPRLSASLPLSGFQLLLKVQRPKAAGFSSPRSLSNRSFPHSGTCSDRV
jgi:hypothetical protein